MYPNLRIHPNYNIPTVSVDNYKKGTFLPREVMNDFKVIIRVFRDWALFKADFVKVLKTLFI
jgi:hypothetical protein